MLAATCERRYAEGSLARPEDVEAIPWPDRDLDWLASSLGFLRTVTKSLAHLTEATGAIAPRQEAESPGGRRAPLDNDPCPPIPSLTRTQARGEMGDGERNKK